MRSYADPINSGLIKRPADLLLLAEIFAQPRGRTWIYDIETIINCFAITFVNLEEPRIYFQFVLGSGTKGIFPRLLDELREIQKFVDAHVKALVGFNNKRFDSIITNFLLTECDPESIIDPDKLPHALYQLAMSIINKENKYKTTLSIPELDPFLIHHFDNPARATSLKWIECYYNMENIQEMPHPADRPITTAKELDDLLWYNKNDCLATRLLHLDPKTKDLISIRKWAAKEYNKPSMMNMSNSSMGEAILRVMLEGAGEIDSPYERRTFHLGEIILPIVNFQTERLNVVLDKVASFKVDAADISPRMEVTFKYGKLQYVMGLGGIHAAMDESSHTDIDSVDVTSYYPRLAVVHKIHPRHIDQVTFTQTLDAIFAQRAATLKGSAKNKALKETLNSAIGKMNSKYSFLYDRQANFAVTINGQLLILMLCERITESGAGEVVMANTDGIEVKVLNRPVFETLLIKWQKLTGLNLESSFYSKLMIRDVNNYIALKKPANGPDGIPMAVSLKHSVKAVGAYQFEKEFHKDPSMKIVPKAIANWFALGQNLGEFVKNHTIILDDYYLYARAKTGSFVAYTADAHKVEIPKTVRYLITDKGWTLTRKSDGKRRDKVHKDAVVSILNDRTFRDPSDEELRKMIDLKWYLKEVHKLVVKPKTSMFSTITPF